ncbi:MAG: TetR/AcrR family transcriptional regulator [Myxococcales bacterium]|nr:TetR/AcrR family transcriptional regulator [Myxococcales bacterium]
MAAKRGSRSKTTAARPRASDRQARRQQILEAARVVFAKRGYHQTTIEHIVAEAGVARGTFYLYFEDKRSVFGELIDRFSARISMAISSIIVDDATRSVAEQARGNIHAIIGLALQEREMTKILFTDAVGLDPGFDRKLYSFYDEVVQLLTESLRQGQRLGIVADGEPRVLAYLTIGALKELLTQVVTLGLTADSAEVLTAQLYDFLSRGYLRVEPAAQRPNPKKREPRPRTPKS